MSSDDDRFERAFEDHGEVEREEDRDHGDDQRGTEPSGNGSVDADEADSSAEDSPFAEDFSEALTNAPDPDLDSDAVGPDPPSGAGSDADAGSEPSVVDGGDVDAFDDSADFGFSGAEFDPDDFDSDLERLEIGVEGLDEMVLGGIPRRSLIAAIGSAGTGKTTIGMQFLNTALENGERAVYIALEESRQRVLDTAEEKGWEFRRYEDEESLVIVDLNPVEMANSLSSIRNDLTRLIDDFDAERLVLDSVSLLEMMYDHPARRRSEVYQFTHALKQAGVTTLFTSEASETDPFVSRHGIVEYLADAVLVLRYVRSNSFQETRLAIEIQKIRDANHSRQPKPYEITDEGISVHQQANLF